MTADEVDGARVLLWGSSESTPAAVGGVRLHGKEVS